MQPWHCTPPTGQLHMALYQAKMGAPPSPRLLKGGDHSLLVHSSLAKHYSEAQPPDTAINGSQPPAAKEVNRSTHIVAAVTAGPRFSWSSVPAIGQLAALHENLTLPALERAAIFQTP
jgi:hypothetical protein